MEVGRSLTGHWLTGINKTEPQKKGEGLRLGEDNLWTARRGKEPDGPVINKEVTDTMRKKLTVLNATVGYGPTSHGLAENKRTIDPRFSDRIFLLYG